MARFNLPDLGEGLQEAEIIRWHVAVGDVVAIDQPLVAMETAKAVVEVPSPHTGTILALHGQPGDTIADTLPPFDFGRIAAQSAKQVIVQKVREAERDRQFDEFKDRIGTIVNGLVKRVEYGNVIVDLGRGEAVLRRDDLIPREMFRPGDRIRAYLFDVRREQRGPQIFLSRTHPQFMAKLFTQEVPEIYDGIIEVKAVARDPGSRAKIAVISRDGSIDPVGACVGMLANKDVGARVGAGFGDGLREKRRRRRRGAVRLRLRSSDERGRGRRQRATGRRRFPDVRK
jgi:transcription termination factor NusA